MNAVVCDVCGEVCRPAPEFRVIVCTDDFLRGRDPRDICGPDCLITFAGMDHSAVQEGAHA